MPQEVDGGKRYEVIDRSPSGVDVQGVLKLLANPTNQAVLNLLQAEPSYARKIAALLDLKESEVTRRLRQLEEAGLVSSEWTYIGKNVKLYNLEVDGLAIRFEPEGMRIDMGKDGEAKESLVTAIQVKIPPVASLCGRTKELAALATEHPVHVVAGMPGIGKTSLLAYFAQELQSYNVFWHSFRGIESLHWLGNRLGVFASHHGDHRLLEAVQRDEDPVAYRELLLDIIDDPENAIFFDDVHHIEDEQVRMLVEDAIRHTTRGRLYISSRSRLLAAKGVQHVVESTLVGLPDEDVLKLLEDDGTPVTPDILQRLRPVLGGHPLGLHLLASAVKQTGSDLATLLDRAEAGKAGDLQEYLLQELDERITEGQRRALTTASIFRTSFTVDDLAAVSTKTVHEKVLMDLAREHLLLDRGDRYDMHDIVRSFFRNMLDDARPLHEKAAKHFLDSGSTEGRIEAMHHLHAAGKSDAVLRLVDENLDVRDYDFIDAGYAKLYLGLLEMFDEAAVRDPARWAVILDEKGDVHFSQGSYEEAIRFYEQAHAYFETDPDADEGPDLAWKRAMAHHRLGQHEPAAHLVDAALARDVPAGRTRDRLERLREDLKALAVAK